MREGSFFKLESVDRLDYKLHKIKSWREGSYIKSPEWIRNKTKAINPKNEDDDNCFQYALTVALNYQNIEKALKECRKLSHLSISIIGKK